MNKRKNWRRLQAGAAALAFAGIALMLTEYNGGPWAGTVIGTLMFAYGTLRYLIIKNRREEK